jgi:hypothetical protein
VSRGAAYNVVDNEPVTFADYRREMARVAGAKPPLKVPYLLARLAMPYGALFLARAQLSASNERIKRELGWRPEMPTYREALASLAQGSNHSRRPGVSRAPWFAATRRHVDPSRASATGLKVSGSPEHAALAPWFALSGCGASRALAT